MSDRKLRKEREQKFSEWIAGQDFYGLMQTYRAMPLVNQREVVKAFEAVKTAIKEKAREIYTPEANHEDFITVYLSIGGWKAIQLTWSLLHEDRPDSGFWEPEQTGVGAYATAAEATVEAKAWAESEGLEFKSPKEASS